LVRCLQEMHPLGSVAGILFSVSAPMQEMHPLGSVAGILFSVSAPRSDAGIAR